MENRELKFRSWDSKNKEMDFWDVNNIPMFKTENIMQFTGFKDCNGVEIYEGDTMIDVDVILEKNVKLEDTKQQVYWCNKLGCWKLDNTFTQNKESGYLLANDLKDFRFKVVGNIYENVLS